MLCLSKDGTYLPIPTELKECEAWKLPYIPKEDLADGKKFIAITFFGNQGEFCNKKITNFQKEKTKILEKLGYVHVEVSIVFLILTCAKYILCHAWFLIFLFSLNLGCCKQLGTSNSCYKATS